MRSVVRSSLALLLLVVSVCCGASLRSDDQYDLLGAEMVQSAGHNIARRYKDPVYPSRQHNSVQSLREQFGILEAEATKNNEVIKKLLLDVQGLVRPKPIPSRPDAPPSAPVPVNPPHESNAVGVGSFESDDSSFPVIMTDAPEDLEASTNAPTAPLVGAAQPSTSQGSTLPSEETSQATTEGATQATSTMSHREPRIEATTAGSTEAPASSTIAEISTTAESSTTEKSSTTSESSPTTDGSSSTTSEPEPSSAPSTSSLPSTEESARSEVVTSEATRNISTTEKQESIPTSTTEVVPSTTGESARSGDEQGVSTTEVPASSSESSSEENDGTPTATEDAGAPSTTEGARADEAATEQPQQTTSTTEAESSNEVDGELATEIVSSVPLDFNTELSTTTKPSSE